jgi:hypothetical protein
MISFMDGFIEAMEHPMSFFCGGVRGLGFRV